MTFKNMLPQRIKDISSFIVMDVLERCIELEGMGHDIIHLEVGEPDFDTPECIVRAAVDALRSNKTRYTHSMGLRELREAVSRNFFEKYNVEINPDRVLITAGTSPAMLLALSVLLNRGEEVILSNPHYACYPNFIIYLEAMPSYVPVYEDEGFQYTVEGIKGKLNKKTRAIIINSPSNPTGNIISPDIMADISGLGPCIISDEIYHGLVYEGKERTILEFTDNAFVINGFSKLYAMTGWRLGYLIAPEKFIRPLQRLHQNFFISANAFVQWSGIAALTKANEEVKKMAGEYNKRRIFIIDRLKEIGFGIKCPPTGAFYVLANAKTFCKESFKLTKLLLEEAGVALTPGIDFGDNAEGYIRFSYTNSLENIKIALDRIEKYLRRFKVQSSKFKV